MNTAIRIALSLAAAVVALEATVLVLWTSSTANNTLAGAAAIVVLLGTWFLTRPKNGPGNGKPEEPWDIGAMSHHHGDSA
jgi:hypothetical protein